MPASARNKKALCELQRGEKLEFSVTTNSSRLHRERVAMILIRLLCLVVRCDADDHCGLTYCPRLYD